MLRNQPYAYTDLCQKYMYCEREEDKSIKQALIESRAKIVEELVAKDEAGKFKHHHTTVAEIRNDYNFQSLVQFVQHSGYKKAEVDLLMKHSCFPYKKVLTDTEKFLLFTIEADADKEKEEHEKQKKEDEEKARKALEDSPSPVADELNPDNNRLDSPNFRGRGSYYDESYYEYDNNPRYNPRQWNWNGIRNKYTHEFNP